MKKILLTAALLILTLSASAQSKHLTFKGVPIDGPRKTFIDNMKQKGFEYAGNQEDISILTGDFAGYKNCIIGVTTLKNKDLVSTIAVIFPSKDTWSALESDYDNLKEMLTIKYGKPANEVSEWVNCNPRDDKDKMFQLGMDRCKYGASFETDLGSIEVMISHTDFSNCCVILRYVDKINGDAVRAAAIDDL